MVTRSEQLTAILNDLRSSSPDVEGAAVVSLDGFIMASVLPGNAEEDIISAMASALLGISERIAQELLGAEMAQVFVRTATGYVLLNAAGPEGMLVTLTNARAKLGLVFLDTRRASQAIAQIL